MARSSPQAPRESNTAKLNRLEAIEYGGGKRQRGRVRGEGGTHEMWRWRKRRPSMESEQRRTRSTSAARDTALARRTAQW
jgi:hypothetical protein